MDKSSPARSGSLGGPRKRRYARAALRRDPPGRQAMGSTELIGRCPWHDRLPGPRVCSRSAGTPRVSPSRDGRTAPHPGDAHSINESDGAHWAGKAIWYEPRNDQERHGLPCSAAKHEYDEHATTSVIAASNNYKPAATMNGGQPIDLIAGAGGRATLGGGCDRRYGHARAEIGEVPPATAGGRPRKPPPRD
jgi:hypothetical protein